MGDYGFQGTERYQVVSLVGGGGMGLVYEVFDTETQSNVALKVLEVDTVESTLRFRNEFRSLQDIQHPNLITLGELGESEGVLFFTMELIDGADFLGHLTDLEGDALFAEIRDITTQLARGLVALHRAKKLHRDVKPSNVLVARTGRVVLLDFGLAVDIDNPDRLTAADAMVGTSAYMAPEQSRSIDIGPPADCYAVGVMLFEALTGRLPFEGSGLEVVMQKQRNDPPDVRSLVEDVPEDLASLCMDLLSRKQDQRPNALDIVTRLGGVPSSSSDSIPPPTAEATGRRVAPVGFVGRTRELETLLAAVEDRPRTVFIRGLSGVGKTELVRELEKRVASDELLFLAGRCYERESVPFKGIDAVVDALVVYLRTLDDEAIGSLFTDDARLLMHTFPALRRLTKLRWNEMPVRRGLPPMELRRRTFAALRDVFGALAERGRVLVVAIDDMQWADADAWAMLEHLMQPPAPSVLLVLTVRPAASDEADVELATSIPGHVDVIELQALSFPEANELARAMLRALDVSNEKVAEQLARESEGHPLFLRELASHVAASGSRTQRGTRLEDALHARIDQLSAPARRLLYYACVIGFPIAQLTIAEAAGLDFTDYLRVVAELRTANLVRTTGSRAADKIEPYHDRIRETSVNRMDNEALREVHANIAYALEQAGSGNREPGLVMFHLVEAGLDERAVHYAMVAAKMAADALAYDNAATFYESALRLAGDAEDIRELRLKLGDALVNAGRSAKAAETFLAAAKGAKASVWLDCHRRAAEQLLYSGQIEAGTKLLARVLAHIGEKWPATQRRALMSLLWQRFKLRVRGLAFKVRDESEIAPRDATRVEVYKSMGSGLSLVDNIRAADYQCRHLLLSLDLGEPQRIIRALSVECVFLASQNAGRARKLAKRVRDMAAESGDGASMAYSLFAVAAVDYFMDTDWDAAARTLAEAEILLRSHVQTGGWETDTVRMFRCFCWMNTGQLGKLAERLPAYVRAADRRGDRYSSVNLRTRLVITHLMQDDADAGERDVQDAVDSWMSWRDVFLVQHFYALHSLCEVELYRGDVERAAERLAEQLQPLRASMLLRIPLVAAEMLFVRGRVAIALGDAPGARKLVNELAKVRVPLAGAIAPILEASAEAIDGNFARAQDMLRASLPRLEERRHMAHLWAARYHLAMATGNDERAHTPRLWFEKQGVRNVDAFTDMLVTGWRRR